MTEIKKQLSSNTPRQRHLSELKAVAFEKDGELKVSAISFIHEQAELIAKNTIHSSYNPAVVNAISPYENDFSLVIKALAIGKLALVEDSPEIMRNAFFFECGDNPCLTSVNLLGGDNSHLMDTFKLYAVIELNPNENSYFRMGYGATYLTLDPTLDELGFDIQLSLIARLLLSYALSSQKPISVHYVCGDDEHDDVNQELSKQRLLACKQMPFLSDDIKATSIQIGRGFCPEKIKESKAERLLIVVNKDVASVESVALAAISIKGDKSLMILSY